MLEDEVEELKILITDWRIGSDRDLAFYGQDLITAAGMGNLIMV